MGETGACYGLAILQRRSITGAARLNTFDKKARDGKACRRGSVRLGTAKSASEENAISAPLTSSNSLSQTTTKQFWLEEPLALNNFIRHFQSGDIICGHLCS